MKRLVMSIYHAMQRNYFSFRILVWLKEHGVTRMVNSIFQRSNDKELRQSPSNQMLQSKLFFENNKERLDTVLQILSDEKSREIMKAVIAYRTDKRPIPKNIYSENDQYFVKDLIEIENEEVFVDGGAYTGDTIQQFIDTAKKHNSVYKRIVAFEPGSNYNLISKFYNGNSRVVCINKGLSDRTKNLYFCEGGSVLRRRIA